MSYTIGQGRGLFTGGQNGEDGSSWFIIEMDVKNAISYAGHGSEDRLYSKGLIMNEINWIPYKPQGDVIECTGKFRYRQPEQKCRIIVKENGYEVEFEEKQRAITEGQFAVFYQEEKCIGGGVIEKAIF